MENGKRIEFNGVVKIVILAIVMLTITGITAVGIAAGAKETVVAFEDQGYTVKITFPDGEGIEHTRSKEFVLRDRCVAEDVNLIDVRGWDTYEVINISIEIKGDSDIQWSLFKWQNSHNYPLYRPVDKDTRTNEFRVLPITVRPIASDLPHRFYTRIYKITVREVEKEYQPWLDIYFTLVLAGRTIPEIKQTNKPPVAHASVVSESRPELEPGSHISVEYGENVIFSAAESYDSDGEIDLYTWRCYTWRWNGTLMALGEVTQRRYLPIGKNVVTLEVQDNKGAMSTDTVVVTVTEKAKGKLVLRVRRPFRSTYDIGDEVGIVFDVINVGTVDVECRTDYFVVDPFGDLVSEINSGLPNIAAGKEHQWAPLKWQIPSTAKTGEYTIEAFLVWSSGSTDAVASFTVTETAVKEATKPPAVSTTPIEETIEEGPAKSSGSADAVASFTVTETEAEVATVKSTTAQAVTSTASSVPVLPSSAPTLWNKIENICNGREEEPTVYEVEWITYLQHVEDANPDMTRAQIITALHYDQYLEDVYRNLPPPIEWFIKIPLFQHGSETSGFKDVDLLVKNPPRFVMSSEKIDIAHSYTALRSDLDRENTGWIDSIWAWTMRHANTDWGDWWQVVFELNLEKYSDAQKVGNDLGHWLCEYYDKPENKDKPLSEVYRVYFSTH